MGQIGHESGLHKPIKEEERKQNDFHSSIWRRGAAHFKQKVGLVALQLSDDVVREFRPSMVLDHGVWQIVAIDGRPRSDR